MGSLCSKNKKKPSSSTNVSQPTKAPSTSEPTADAGAPLSSKSSADAPPQEAQSISKSSAEAQPSDAPSIPKSSADAQPPEAPSISKSSEKAQPPEAAWIPKPSADGQPPAAQSLMSNPELLPEEQQREVPQQRHSTPPPQQRHSKRALLCGVTYKTTDKELKETINDVKDMKKLLIDYFGFMENNMRILTEEEENPDLIPTKNNILEGLKWLVEGCCSGDSLVFYFAGHGTQEKDFFDDERDGKNEAICPSDYMKEGTILDNDINSIIVWPLKKGVKLHAIIDSCHSGTMLDLSRVYNRNKKRWEDNSPLSADTRKGTEGGLAISICACQDNEEAVDTSALQGSKEMKNGAFTNILIQKVMGSPVPLTYGKLLDLINEAIEAARKGGTANFFKRMLGNNAQKPQLSSSETFDVDNTDFQM